MAKVRRVVVSDANVVINLIHVDRLDLLGRLPGYEFVIPDHVPAEITDPKQHDRLMQAIEAGDVRPVSITTVATIEFYGELKRSMGSGEATCIALAVEHGWLVACDERKSFRREATRRLGEGRIITTAGLLLMAIRAGVIRVEQADHAKAVLEQHRFTINIGSFAELVEPNKDE